jgi:predicted permease
MIIFGWIAGKKLNVQRESIAPLLLYIVVPVVTFKAIFLTDLNAKTFSYPLYFFITGTFMAISFFYIGKMFLSSREQAGLLSLSASLANVGYFGLPLVFALYGEQALGITVLLILGLSLHESFTAFLIAARGKYHLKDALRKTLRLPTIYTSILAVVCNLAYKNYYMPGTFWDPVIKSFLDMADKFIGAYSFLGMLMIGLGLAKINKLSFDFKFISLSLIAKYLVFPALALGFIYLDTNFWHFYPRSALDIIFLMSIVPTGANTISIATELDLDTDTVSITVLLSTLFALVYIPWVLSGVG